MTARIDGDQLAAAKAASQQVIITMRSRVKMDVGGKIVGVQADSMTGYVAGTLPDGIDRNKVLDLAFESIAGVFDRINEAYRLHMKEVNSEEWKKRWKK